MCIYYLFMHDMFEYSLCVYRQTDRQTDRQTLYIVHTATTTMNTATNLLSFAARISQHKLFVVLDVA